jgi:hypothetical protein
MRTRPGRLWTRLIRLPTSRGHCLPLEEVILIVYSLVDDCDMNISAAFPFSICWSMSKFRDIVVPVSNLKFGRTIFIYFEFTLAATHRCRGWSTNHHPLSNRLLHRHLSRHSRHGHPTINTRTSSPDARWQVMLDETPEAFGLFTKWLFRDASFHFIKNTSLCAFNLTVGSVGA